MGNKISPNLYRYYLSNNWLIKSSSVVNAPYKLGLYNKVKFVINSYLGSEYFNCFYLELFDDTIIVTIYSLRPGYIIGNKGKRISDIKNKLISIINMNCYINVYDSYLYCDDLSFFIKNISNKILNRDNYRIFIKMYSESFILKKFKGIKTIVSGRADGSDISKKETFIYGSVSLNSYKSKIIYRFEKIITKYGIVGLKVFLFF